MRDDLTKQKHQSTLGKKKQKQNRTNAKGSYEIITSSLPIKLFILSCLLQKLKLVGASKYFLKHPWSRNLNYISLVRLQDSALYFTY